jgi:hypothetical protein
LRRFGEDVVTVSCAPRVAARGREIERDDTKKKKVGWEGNTILLAENPLVSAFSRSGSPTSSVKFELGGTAQESA